MQNEIKKVWHFNQSPKVVWEYLTKPELIEQWFGNTDFQPIVGHKFSITGKQGNVINCEVLELTPPLKLSYSWQRPSAKDQKFYTSKVEWTLTETNSGTELQLLHNGFVELEDFNAHNDGWTVIINRLIELLQSKKNENTDS